MGVKYATFITFSATNSMCFSKSVWLIFNFHWFMQNSDVDFSQEISLREAARAQSSTGSVGTTTKCLSLLK